jgi:hypothetical protein
MSIDLPRQQVLAKLLRALATVGIPGTSPGADDEQSDRDDQHQHEQWPVEGPGS